MKQTVLLKVLDEMIGGAEFRTVDSLCIKTGLAEDMVKDALKILEKGGHVRRSNVPYEGQVLYTTRMRRSLRECFAEMLYFLRKGI